MYLWVGRSIPRGLIMDVFGVDSVEAIDVTMVFFISFPFILINISVNYHHWKTNPPHKSAVSSNIYKIPQNVTHVCKLFDNNWIRLLKLSLPGWWWRINRWIRWIMWIICVLFIDRFSWVFLMIVRCGFLGLVEGIFLKGYKLYYYLGISIWVKIKTREKHLKESFLDLLLLTTFENILTLFLIREKKRYRIPHQHILLFLQSFILCTNSLQNPP